MHPCAHLCQLSIFLSRQNAPLLSFSSHRGCNHVSLPVPFHGHRLLRLLSLHRHHLCACLALPPIHAHKHTCTHTHTHTHDEISIQHTTLVACTERTCCCAGGRTVTERFSAQLPRVHWSRPESSGFLIGECIEGSPCERAGDMECREEQEEYMEM